MAGVTIDNLVKEYGSLRALHGISAEVKDGEFVVLVGPSGCGKSTLLRMIAGLEDITDGTISIGNRVVNALPPKQRDISMVFQSYALYPHKTVFENMAFPLTLAGASHAEKKEKVDHAAEILGLTTHLERRPKELSGGQRQRVAMGRSIVRDPQVFLFDEPLSNLDAKLRVQMRGEVKALHRRLGTTMIYVTHDQVEAMTMADRIVVMQAGRIEQVGTPLDLYDRPCNTFVAGFIGSPAMTMFEARARGGEMVLEDGRPTGVPAPKSLSQDRPVWIGKRPENIRLSVEGSMSARVENIEPMGSETMVEMRMKEEAFTVLLRDRPTFGIDDELGIDLTGGAVHIFDRETGLRLGDEEELA